MALQKGTNWQFEQCFNFLKVLRKQNAYSFEQIAGNELYNK